MKQCKVAVIADLHYYSPTLGTTGEAYRIRSSTDQKCLAESGAIIDAAFEQLKKSDCEAVLIAGDISNDGEKVCHREVMEKLRDLQKSKPVFVIYSTHDWCASQDAARYEGDKVIRGEVETMTQPELREFYHDFGIKDCISEYVHPNGSSSYCAKIKDGFRVIGVNDDYSGTGKAGYTDEHMEWMRQQIRDAKEAGDRIIAMEHHLMIPCLTMLVNSMQIIGDWQKRAGQLADAGLELMFVGHSHMQRISRFTSENGNTICQVNVGSLVGHPAPINYLTMTDEEMRLDVDTVKSFTYDGQTLGADFLREHTQGVLKNILDNAEKGRDALTEQLKGYGLDFNKVKIPYGIIRYLARHLNHDTISQAASKINALTFGKGIDKKAAKALQTEPLNPYIYRIFLSVMDGTREPMEPGTPIHQICADVSTLPRRICAHLPVKALKTEKFQRVLDDIETTVRELACPSEFNSYHAVITGK